MRGRFAALLASIALGCAACEALVGIKDREVSQADANTRETGGANQDADVASDVGAGNGNDAGSPPAADGATYACAKGGCNAPGGACAGPTTCSCTSDGECPGSKCVSATGRNDLACGSGCTGTGAADGFGCQLAACVQTHFGYTPSSFKPGSYSAPSAATTDCNGTYSSTSHTFTGGGCSGQTPTIVASAAQKGGGHAVDILVFQSLSIAATSTLTIVGANPVVLAVYGNATIRGVIDASASGATPGAGGDVCAASSAGADAGTGSWEPGGGGAGQASAGGVGGASRGASGEAAGNAQGTGPVPLTGGCAGGLPFVGSLGYSPTIGAGGGAVQISAAGVLDLTAGTVRANGSNGGNGERGGCTAAIAQNGTGGSGGGSGGTVLLEGSTVVQGTVLANGGSGGTGGAAPSPNSQGGGDGGAGGAAGAGGAVGGAGVQKGTSPTGCTWGGYWSGGGGGGGGGGYVKSTQGGGACACTADSDCASGLCANVASQCTGTCTGSTAAGTYDAIDCQVLTATTP